MKNFTFSILLIFAALIGSAQTATFDWVKDTVSAGNTLQGMSINTVDGSAVLIGYDNTFLKSEDNGTNWHTKTMFSPVYDFIGMAQAEDVVFISSRREKVIDHPSGGYPDVYVSGVLLKSTNMGASWEALDINAAGFGDDVTVNPNADGGYAKDVYAIGALNKDTIIGYAGWYDQTSGSKVSRGAVFRTNNGGSTWWKLTPDLGSKIISCVEVKDSIAAFGGYKNMFVTNLITDSVTNIYDSLVAAGTDDNIFVNNITFTTPQSFYVSTVSDGIFKTEDTGNTFIKLSEITGVNDLFVINDSTLITLGSSSKSKISTDNGLTWVDCYPGATCYKIGGIMADTLYGMAIDVAYKCAVSDIIARNPVWSTVNVFEGENRLQKMAVYGTDKAVIAGYGTNCKYTTDGGLTWSKSTLPNDYLEDLEFDFNDISSCGDDAFATVRRYKIADMSDIDSVQDLYMEGLLIKTEDNWETSIILDASKIGAEESADPTLNPQLDECWGFNPYTVECVDATIAYVWGNWYEDVTEGKKKDRSRVFKTIDGGDSWIGITPDFGNSYVNDIEFKGDTGFIVGNKILWRTDDAATSFIDLYPNMVAANDGDSSIFLKRIHMISTQEFYIPTTTDGVFFTTDGGETFTKFEGVAGTNDIIKLDANSFLCMGTTSKSYFTNDAGATWQNPSAGTTVYSIGGIMDDKLFALAKGVLFNIALANLELKTAIPTLYTKAELNVAYTPTSIDLISTDGEIELCSMYTISGKLVLQAEPNNSVFRLNNNQFQTGIYIVNSVVEGKRYVNKIAFR
ncbi:hypothetical protein [uncultured Draconibacterium sp.]|uniref:WD40/YVTN/BNR-like repeat-containing protein n=1 Tax=uncultured Draconibacterium sp. TaxID=1573823 RepID=UPI0025EB6D62|nr:hypothetical protein [uncultured Draconibacterium sp.]